MSQMATTEPVAALTEKKRAALLTLLADDDPLIYHTVRSTILSFGPSTAQWLRPHTLSLDPALRRRTQEIIVHFERQAADDRFLAFCLRHGEEFDLEQGTWLFAQSRYPEINVEAYRAVLDSYAAELRTRIEPRGAAKRILQALNEYLFVELGFSGNEENYYDPDNSYLNRVLDRRTGNPINLSLLYVLLAKRLALPITGIGLPGRFVCRHQSSSAEIYIDVFSGGTLLTKADCVQYLLNTNFSVRDEYLTPVSTRRFLLRVCANLHQIYLQKGWDAETTRIQRYIVALAR